MDLSSYLHNQFHRQKTNPQATIKESLKELNQLDKVTSLFLVMDGDVPDGKLEESLKRRKRIQHQGVRSAFPTVMFDMFVEAVKRESTLKIEQACYEADERIAKLAIDHDAYVLSTDSDFLVYPNVKGLIAFGDLNTDKGVAYACTQAKLQVNLGHSIDLPILTLFHSNDFILPKESLYIRSLFPFPRGQPSIQKTAQFMHNKAFDVNHAYLQPFVERARKHYGDLDQPMMDGYRSRLLITLKQKKVFFWVQGNIHKKHFDSSVFTHLRALLFEKIFSKNTHIKEANHLGKEYNEYVTTGEVDEALLKQLEECPDYSEYLLDLLEQSSVQLTLHEREVFKQSCTDADFLPSRGTESVKDIERVKAIYYYMQAGSMLLNMVLESTSPAYQVFENFNLKMFLVGQDLKEDKYPSQKRRRRKGSYEQRLKDSLDGIEEVVDRAELLRDMLKKLH